MDKLKPCPFCGEPVEFNKYAEKVVCEDCGATIYLDCWNTRPIEDKLLAQLAERDALIERLVEVGNDIVEEAQMQEPDVQELRDNWRVLIAEYRASKAEGENE